MQFRKPLEHRRENFGLKIHRDFEIFTAIIDNHGIHSFATVKALFERIMASLPEKSTPRYQP